MPGRYMPTTSSDKAAIARLLKKGLKGPMPEHVQPMLCTLTKDVLDDARFLYEIKWDGYRILAQVNNGLVRMNSRSGLDYTSKYPPVTKALAALKRRAL